MPKGPKFKRGFTWRHHLDEWWDRRTQEWKIRMMVLFGVVMTIAALALIFWAHGWTERDELITHAKELHKKRIQKVDVQMASEPSTQPQALMPQSTSFGVRPGE